MYQKFIRRRITKEKETKKPVNGGKLNRRVGHVAMVTISIVPHVMTGVHRSTSTPKNNRNVTRDRGLCEDQGVENGGPLTPGSSQSDGPLAATRLTH